MRLCSLVLLLATLCASAQAYTDKAFGDYYPHTRWIDRETSSITVDAFSDRLIISQRGKPTRTIHGCWRGRAFLRDCRSDFFGVAHEGIDAYVDGDPRFEKFNFRRVRPDPKT